MQSPSDDGNRGGQRHKADAAEIAAHGCEFNDSELYGRDALGPDTYYLFESEPDDSCDFACDTTRLVDSWTEPRVAPGTMAAAPDTLSVDPDRDTTRLSDREAN